jgi:hypothetical protein
MSLWNLGGKTREGLMIISYKQSQEMLVLQLALLFLHLIFLANLMLLTMLQFLQFLWQALGMSQLSFFGEQVVSS